MNDILDISHLTRPQKMLMMETLWADLSSDDEMVDAPSWHALALAESERLVEAGQEQPIDWSAAKDLLRN